MIIQDISQAKYGDIILFEPTSVIGRVQVVIDNLSQPRKFNFSHGAIFLERVGDSCLMVESVNRGGVRIAPLQEWKNYTIVRPEGFGIIMPKKRLISKIYSDYDFNKIGRIFMSRIFNYPLTVDDDRKLICTELVNFAYRYKITKKGQCTPVTLANAIL